MPTLAAKWNRHTPDMKNLPEKKKKKPAEADAEEKKAFVVAFLSKCASAGLTTPKQIAAAAEKLAAELPGYDQPPVGFAPGMDKQNSVRKTAGIGDVAGGVTGAMLAGGAAGIAIPTILGYAGGRAIGAAGNRMDRDDAESLRLRAEANAYRRRAIEAQLGAQVRKIVATDPKKYVVLG
jgi:hypothetical protein